MIRRQYLVVIFLVFISCYKKDVQPNCNENSTLSYFLKNGANPKNSFPKRMDYNFAALKILLRQNNDSLNRDRILKVANNYLYVNEFDSVKKVATIAYDKADQKNSILHIAMAYRFLGLYYENKSQNDSAYYYYLKCEKIFLKLNNLRQLCKIHQNKALIQYYENDYFESENSLIKALQISKRLNFKSEEYRIYLLLGINSIDLKNYNDALNNFLKAAHIANQYINPAHVNAISEARYYIGLAYFKLGDNYKSILHFEWALKGEDLILSDPILYCTLLDDLAYANFKISDFDELPEKYTYTSQIRERLNIGIRKNFNKLYLSEYYAAVKDTPAAITYAHEALNLSREFRAPNDMLIMLKHLTKVDHANALNYSNQYITISDSIQQLERLTRNKFAKIAYETEEITQEKDEAVKQKGIYLAIAITVLAFGLMLFIMLNQRSKQKELIFLQNQQKRDHEIYQLIETQQSKIDEGRQIEKKRIAQDLHDGIMNKLASTRFNLFILNKKTDPETVQRCIPFINGIHDIEKEIRSIAHDLNNEVFSANDSFKNIILSLFSEQKALTKAKWHIEINPDINWELIKSNKKVHMYRILQEVLQNIHKHAKADNIIISIFIENKKLFLEIYDDGIGFSLNGTKKGIGLQNIFSRVKECAGTIDIKTKKGQGTTIAITIPTDSKTKSDNGNKHKHFNS